MFPIFFIMQPPGLFLQEVSQNSCYYVGDQYNLDETHLDAVRGLIQLRGFAQCVNTESSSERRNYVRAEQTDLLYADAKDLIQSRKI